MHFHVLASIVPILLLIFATNGLPVDLGMCIGPVAQRY